MTSSCKILIDNRETYFVDKLINEENENYVQKTLDIGDFHFICGDFNYLIVERKTYSDLISSIKDGRYREQKLRLKDYRDKNGCKIVYLIEEDSSLKNGYICGIPVKTLYGSMIKCMLRDNIYVYRSDGLENSLNFLLTVEKYINNGDLNIEKVDILGENKYASVIKTQKKANMTYSNCYIAQLKQIPGISTNGAVAISNVYKNMFDMIDSYNKIDDIKGKFMMLKDIKVGKKKLGKKTSEKIYKYISCYDE